MDIFDLTPLTLKANEGRRITMRGFDFDRRQFWIFVISSFYVLPCSAIAFALSGNSYPVLIVVALILYSIPFALIETRTTEGLKLRRYQALMDRHKSNRGKFIMCNTEIHPATFRPRILRSLSLPVEGSSSLPQYSNHDDANDAIFSSR